MIAKGTAHNNGARLAVYMTTGKDGERAELWQLRGFAAEAIKDAFRSVHVMAEATHCAQPFFHAQVRNPEGEELTRAQWERAADRLEAKLGYSGQPRAIAFHIDEATGHEHMHVAWSRIDEERMVAKPLPFFKLRLKETCRELEQELGLTPVRNERPGTVMAPERAEDEQARRLDVDLRATRQTIRDCFDRADSGKAFAAALADHDLTLAQGERRDFLVIDAEGGLHALGQRILGVTAAQTRARLADLDREALPTVAEARQHLAERAPPSAPERIPEPIAEPTPEPTPATPTARGAYQELKQAARAAEPLHHFDRDAQDAAWQAGIADSAEQAERAATFARLTTPQTTQEPTPEVPRRAAPELGQTAGQIRLACSLTADPQAFADALEDRGLILARVPAETAGRALPAPQPNSAPWMTQTGGADALSAEHRASAQHSYAAWRLKDTCAFENYVSYAQKKWAGQHPEASATPRQEELVVVNPFGGVHRLTEHSTGLERAELATYLAGIDRAPLLAVDDARAVMADTQQQQREEWQQARAAERRAAYVETRSAQLAGNATVREIGRAYADSASGPEFVAALEERGLIVARVSAREAARSATQHDTLRRTPMYEAGEYLAVNERGRMFRLDGTTIHAPESAIFERLAEIDPAPQLTLAQTADIVHYRRQEAEPDWTRPVVEAAHDLGHAAGKLAYGGATVAGGVGRILGGALRVAEAPINFVIDFLTGGVAEARAPAAAPPPQKQKPDKTPVRQAQEALRHGTPEMAARDPGTRAIADTYVEHLDEAQRAALRRQAEEIAARQRENWGERER